MHTMGCGAFYLIKKHGGSLPVLYIVGHSSSVANPPPVQNAPLNLQTMFTVRAPFSMNFYCPDRTVLKLNTGMVVSGANSLPPVVDCYSPGSRIRDHFIYPANFLQAGGLHATVEASCRMLEQAVDYNDSATQGDALMVKHEKVRLSDILTALSVRGLVYNTVNCMFCRS